METRKDNFFCGLGAKWVNENELHTGNGGLSRFRTLKPS